MDYNPLLSIKFDYFTFDNIFESKLKNIDYNRIESNILRFIC